jgi:exonuclease III
MLLGWTATASLSNSAQVQVKHGGSQVFMDLRGMTIRCFSCRKELRDVRAACQGPWIVLGDYNLIYREEDKNNGNLNRALMGRFRRLINVLGLQELPLHGRKYTWSNQQDTPTLVRLDRFLCTVDWEQLFPNCLLQSTASDGSDHCPLLGLHDN